MTKQASLLAPQDDLTQLLGTDLAAAFVAHRKAIKRPMTEYAAKLMAKRLRELPDPKGSAEQSIRNGWSDVFSVREEQNRSQQRNMPKARGLEGLADDLRRRVEDEYEGQTGTRSGDPEIDRRLSLMGPHSNARPH